MKDISSIEKFKNQSTWRLFFIGVFTYGVYFAHYIQKQTDHINEAVNEQEIISAGYVHTLLALSYLSLTLFFADLFLGAGPVLTFLSSLVDLTCGIMILVWGFKARNRLNAAYEISTEDKEWFHGFWTFMFSPLYFNYKVNCICEDRLEQDAKADTQIAE